MLQEVGDQNTAPGRWIPQCLGDKINNYLVEVLRVIYKRTRSHTITKRLPETQDVYNRCSRRSFVAGPLTRKDSIDPINHVIYWNTYVPTWQTYGACRSAQALLKYLLCLSKDRPADQRGDVWRVRPARDVKGRKRCQQFVFCLVYLLQI